MIIKIKKINPSRDWRVIVSLFGLALILISFFSWQIYLSDKIGGGFFTREETPAEGGPRAIDTKRLQKAVSLSEKRTEDLSNLKENLLRPIDPSL